MGSRPPSLQYAVSRGLNLSVSESLEAPRPFAQWVVQKLQVAGHQALFAGGCVRDQLMGREPKDYDVATSALPEQVRELFGKRRTIAVGAAFGVITVIGNQSTGNVEVATFRCDGGYSDGRRPDSVTYTDAQNDALRRDFTINGLFLNPMTDEILDFVGGQADLNSQTIRAIGDPQARFEEDRLRMLRAIRFATTLDFAIAPETLNAVAQNAHAIESVSGERIAAEMVRMLQSEFRSQGLKLLLVSGLAHQVLPEWQRLSEDQKQWMIEQLQPQPIQHPSLGHWGPELTLALLIWLNQEAHGSGTTPPGESDTASTPKPYRSDIGKLVQRWKLSNQFREILSGCLEDVGYVLWADTLPWSQVQPKLVKRWAKVTLEFARLIQARCPCAGSGIQFADQKLQQPVEALDPPPLLTGHDLAELGIPRGPETGRWMRKIRSLQLDGQLKSDAAARNYVLSNPSPSND